ncbi:MAG: SIMPL domain-containing protein, partial [Paracoccaceae bacterium]|nr:SIMPL domain-containing protein [Paracoccaceae bacterium]
LADPAPGQITVTGEGSVSVAPDMATVTLGVTSEGATAAAAMAQNSAQLAAVIAQLKGAGIAEKDVQTSGLSLGPRWDNSASSVGKAPKIVGYVATNTVSVRVRALDHLGGVLDSVVKNGANTFSGVSFDIAARQPSEDAARKAAVVEALRKARLYADAAGVKLGTIQSITEDAGGRPVPVRLGAFAMAKATSVPVAEGEMNITADVTVVINIAP